MSEKTNRAADIVFLMDATGSMQNCIDRLKENVKMFIQTMTEDSSPVRDWRAKVVGYRDYNSEGPDLWFEDNPFSNDVEALYQQLNKLKAFGGGDIPESLLDAIYKVVNMEQSESGEQADPAKWRCRSNCIRILIIFTDASFHEPMNIPEAHGGNVEDIINLLHNQHIVLSVYAPRFDADSNMIQPDYIRLTSANRAEYIPLTGNDGTDVTLDEFTSNIENFQETLRQLAKTVTRTANVLEL